MELTARTWTEIDGPLLVIPVGSTEQHGPHLPLSTDSVIAEALATTLARRRSDCLVAPCLTISASGEHAGFPGTLSIGTEVMTSVVVELARSADWASGLIFVNGHGGNVVPLRRAEHTLTAEGRNVFVWSPPGSADDLHAGFAETSIMLALAPALVRQDAAVAGPRPGLGELVQSGVQAVSPSGVLGDPTGASAEEGVRLLAEFGDRLVDAVSDWVGT